jgi:hypothetical protein
MSTMKKIRLTKRGVVLLSPAGGKETIVAPPIRLFASGGEGSLRDWQKYVAKPARKSSTLCVSISAAFAAPLLRKLNMDSFALNWFGTTSEGKTLALKSAASVAGLFGPGGGLPSWADSEPGFAAQAMGHRDCIMPLDETAEKKCRLKNGQECLHSELEETDQESSHHITRRSTVYRGVNTA